MARPHNIDQFLNLLLNHPEVYAPLHGRGPAARTAQAATYLNYGPQFEALAALLSGAQSQKRTGIQSARRSGLAGSQGIQQIRDSFTHGAQETLGGLGGPVASGAATHTPEERAAQALGLSGTALAGMLSTMAAQQVAGIGNQTSQLNRQFSSARDEIGGKLTGLLGQAGAYNTQQYESLAGDARKARQQAQEAANRLKVSLMTAGIDPVTGKHSDALDPPKPKTPHAPVDGVDYETWLTMSPDQRRAAHKAWAATGRAPKDPSSKTPTLPGGVKLNTNQQHEAFGSRIGEAKTWASRLEGSGLSRHEIAQVLLTGAQSSGGNKVPKIGSELAVSVGLDMALLGYVSPGTVRKLHAAGYSVKKLGLPGRGKRRPEGGSGSGVGSVVGGQT